MQSTMEADRTHANHADAPIPARAMNMSMKSEAGP